MFQSSSLKKLARAFVKENLLNILNSLLDDKITRKKSEEAILETLQELLRLSNNGCEEIKSHYKSLQEYLSKVIQAHLTPIFHIL